MLKNNKRKLLSYCLVGVGIIIGLLFITLWGVSHVKSKVSTKTSSEVTYPGPKNTDHYRLKNKNNRITLINYISLDCVHCKKAYLDEEVFLRNMATSSKNINIIYRHNPLASQPLSQEKALISECVYQQTNDDIFFDFIRTVFSTYDESQKDNLWVKKIAYRFAPSREALDVCMTDMAMQDKIQQQKNENIILDIPYTPTILVFVDNIFVKKYENLSSRSAFEILKYYSNIEQPANRN